MRNTILEEDIIPLSFISPITNEPMTDPVICNNGYSFEKTAILKWLQEHNTNPITRNPLERSQLRENRALKDAISEFFALLEIKNVEIERKNKELAEAQNE